MKISFASPSLPKNGAVVVGIKDSKKLTLAASEIDKRTGGAIKRALSSGRFTGAKGQSLEIVAPAGIGNSRILLVGLGEGLDELEQQALGGRVYARLNSVGELAASVLIDDGVEDLSAAGAQIAYGARLKSYRFDRYRTKLDSSKKQTLRSLAIRVDSFAKARRAFAALDKVSEGVFFTRDLVSAPPNDLYPESFAAETKKLAELGVKVEVLSEKHMQRLGMRALLGVGQGSIRQSHLVVMRWNGAVRNKKPVAFVGKGVTFDTGGISLKPAQGMEEMKWDMGGAGTVSGLMKAVAGRKARANVIGVIGLVENMPGGNAQRPGDIVKSMSGQTIEVINTDAEGRLVLADALWFTQDRFKPRFMIDLATLTGAMITALGHEHAGLFSNDDGLSEKLRAAGEATGEKVWRLPLTDAYDKLIESPVADMKNIGGRPAGSITAAQFLQRFVNKTPWAHLDIAGVAWSSEEADTVPKGGTGYGVRLLDRLVRDYYEE